MDLFIDWLCSLLPIDVFSTLSRILKFKIRFLGVRLTQFPSTLSKYSSFLRICFMCAPLAWILGSLQRSSGHFQGTLSNIFVLIFTNIYVFDRNTNIVVN